LLLVVRGWFVCGVHNQRNQESQGKQSNAHENSVSSFSGDFV
jgi:hypothetical protein